MLKMMQDQFKELERETVHALSQMAEIRRKIREVSGMDEMNEVDIAQIPFAAYEMQLERNLEEKKEIEERHLKEKEQIHQRNDLEKDKMRKHYRNIILWITIPFIVFILLVFGTVAWFLSNYDIMDVSQDGAGINNYAYQTTQGDVIYEPTDSDDSSEKTAQSPWSGDQ